MPFWRRRGVAAVLPAVALGPLPPVPEVPPAPADADGVVARLRTSGVDVAGLEQLGWAGALPVCAWDVPAGSAAVDRWRALRGVHRSTGLWPVLLGPRDQLGETSSVSGGDHEPEAVLDGMRADPGEVMVQLLEAVAQDPVAHERPRLPSRLDELPERFEVSDEPGVLALVPAAAGWQVPGLVSWWGAANVDVAPSDHVAVLRSWDHRFGAELVALTYDTVELAVRRPPTAPADVLALARELDAYCPDAVAQDFGSLEALCLEMVVRRSWRLWWD